MNKLSKTLSIALGIVILGALAGLIYVVNAPALKDAFTEFYILDPDGKAADYTTRLKVGEEGVVIVGIVNRENETMSYLVKIGIDGVTKSELGPIQLADGAKFERVTAFTPEKSGRNQRVEFLLYKQGQTEVYTSLHLWINVTE